MFCSLTAFLKVKPLFHEDVPRIANDPEIKRVMEEQAGKTETVGEEPQEKELLPDISQLSKPELETSQVDPTLDPAKYAKLFCAALPPPSPLQSIATHCCHNSHF